MVSEQYGWWISSLVVGTHVLVVGVDARRRQDVAAALADAGHRVDAAEPGGVVMEPTCRAIVLLDDVPPLQVSEVVRQFLSVLPLEAEVVSRSHPGAGQIVRCVA